MGPEHEEHTQYEARQPQSGGPTNYGDALDHGLDENHDDQAPYLGLMVAVFVGVIALRTIFDVLTWSFGLETGVGVFFALIVGAVGVAVVSYMERRATSGQH